MNKVCVCVCFIIVYCLLFFKKNQSDDYADWIGQQLYYSFYFTSMPKQMKAFFFFNLYIILYGIDFFFLGGGANIYYIFMFSMIKLKSDIGQTMFDLTLTYCHVIKLPSSN